MSLSSLSPSTEKQYKNLTLHSSISAFSINNQMEKYSTFVCLLLLLLLLLFQQASPSPNNDQVPFPSLINN